MGSASLNVGVAGCIGIIKKGRENPMSARSMALLIYKKNIFIAN